MEGEYVIIGGWPVQFLPATGTLGEEALARQTGRAKDKARVLQFLESDALDADRFHDILVPHGLQASWRRFERQFPDDTP